MQRLAAPGMDEDARAAGDLWGHARPIRKIGASPLRSFTDLDWLATAREFRLVPNGSKFRRDQAQFRELLKRRRCTGPGRGSRHSTRTRRKF